MLQLQPAELKRQAAAKVFADLAARGETLSFEQVQAAVASLLTEEKAGAPPPDPVVVAAAVQEFLGEASPLSPAAQAAVAVSQAEWVGETMRLVEPVETDVGDFSSTQCAHPAPFLQVSAVPSRIGVGVCVCIVLVLVLVCPMRLALRRTARTASASDDDPATPLVDTARQAAGRFSATACRGAGSARRSRRSRSRSTGARPPSTCDTAFALCSHCLCGQRQSLSLRSVLRSPAAGKTRSPRTTSATAYGCTSARTRFVNHPNPLPSAPGGVTVRNSLALSHPGGWALLEGAGPPAAVLYSRGRADLRHRRRDLRP